MSALTPEQYERIRVWGELLLDLTLELDQGEPNAAGSSLVSVLSGVTTLESTNWGEVVVQLEDWERAHPEHADELPLSTRLRAILESPSPVRAAL